MKLADSPSLKPRLSAGMSSVKFHNVMWGCAIALFASYGFAAPGAPVHGRVRLTGAYATAKAAQSPRAALFVMAYPTAEIKGAPLAVVRVSHPQFPAEFTLGPENLMASEGPFPDHVYLTAKITARGDAITRDGDLTSTHAVAVNTVAARAGAKSVDLVLDARK